MLPPKIGEGVFGSSSGGVNPTGASFVATSVAASVLSSVAAIFVVLGVNLVGLREMKDRVEGCFHVLGVESGGVKREACVAIAMVNE